jgi:hypothetical protein
MASTAPQAACGVQQAPVATSLQAPPQGGWARLQGVLAAAQELLLQAPAHGACRTAAQGLTGISSQRCAG